MINKNIEDLIYLENRMHFAINYIKDSLGYNYEFDTNIQEAREILRCTRQQIINEIEKQKVGLI